MIIYYSLTLSMTENSDIKCFYHNGNIYHYDNFFIDF